MTSGLQIKLIVPFFVTSAFLALSTICPSLALPRNLDKTDLTLPLYQVYLIVLFCERERDMLET